MPTKFVGQFHFCFHCKRQFSFLMQEVAILTNVATAYEEVPAKLGLWPFFLSFSLALRRSLHFRPEALTGKSALSPQMGKVTLGAHVALALEEVPANLRGGLMNLDKWRRRIAPCHMCIAVAKTAVSSEGAAACLEVAARWPVIHHLWHCSRMGRCESCIAWRCIMTKPTHVTERAFALGKVPAWPLVGSHRRHAHRHGRAHVDGLRVHWHKAWHATFMQKCAGGTVSAPTCCKVPAGASARTSVGHGGSMVEGWRTPNFGLMLPFMQKVACLTESASA